MGDDDVLTFEQLRDLQQQERDKDTLHGLDDRFFDRAKEYLERKQRVGDFKSSKEYRNARHIIEDIIDAREKKIIRLAFLSVTSDVAVDNLLQEEEVLFDQVRESIQEHRKELKADVFGEDDGETEGEKTDENTADEANGQESIPEDGREQPESADKGGDETDTGSDDSTDQEDGSADDGAEEGDGTPVDEEATSDGDDDLLFGSEDNTADSEAGTEDEGPEDDGETAPPSDEESDMATVRIQEDVPEFMGVDMESYGPFEIGDEATIPEENADVLEDQGSAERLE